MQHSHHVDERRVLLQVHLIGHRPAEPGDVLDPARQPVLVLEHGDDDLGNAERGDGEIVRAQAERNPPDDESGTGGEQPADEPGEDYRQAEAAEIAGLGGLHCFYGIHRRVEERPRAEEAGEHNDRQNERAGAAAGEIAGERKREAACRRQDEQAR